MRATVFNSSRLLPFPAYPDGLFVRSPAQAAGKHKNQCAHHRFHREPIHGGKGLHFAGGNLPLDSAPVAPAAGAAQLCHLRNEPGPFGDRLFHAGRPAERSGAGARLEYAGAHALAAFPHHAKLERSTLHGCVWTIGPTEAWLLSDRRVGTGGYRSPSSINELSKKQHPHMFCSFSIAHLSLVVFQLYYCS